MSKHTLVKSFASHRGRNAFSGSPEQVEEYKQLAKALNEQAREDWGRPEFHPAEFICVIRRATTTTHHDTAPVT